MTGKGEKLNFKYVSKDPLNLLHFCSWTALGIKVRRARSIHAPIICFEPCLYMVCYVIINKNNDKRKKKGNTRKRWVVFKLLYYFVKKKEVSLSKICSIRLMKFRICD